METTKSLVISVIFLITSSTALANPPVEAIKKDVAVINPHGGVSAGSVKGGVAPGTLGFGAKAVHTDGSGNGVGGSVKGVRGPRGTKAGYGGYTKKNADGSITHKSGSGLSTKKFGMKNTTSIDKTATGELSATHGTEVQGKQTGRGYEGSTNYTKGEGASHSGSCYDKNGNAIECPKPSN